MQRSTFTPTTSPGSDSALRGATIAFRGSPSPSNTSYVIPPSTYGGALVAASRAGSSAALQWRPSVTPKNLETSNIGDASLAAGRQAVQMRASQALSLSSPVSEIIPRESSPSFIAATRAASRSRASAQNNLSNGQRPKQYAQSIVSSDAGTDDSSIPPTNRLVELFEAKKQAERPQTKVTEKERGQREHSGIISPKPIRPSLSIRIRAPTIPKEAVADPVKMHIPIQSNSQSSATPLRLVKQQSMPGLQQAPTRHPSMLNKDINQKILPAVPSPRRRARSKSIHTETTPVLPKNQSENIARKKPSPKSQHNSSKLPPVLPPPRKARPVSAGPIPGTEYPFPRQTATPPVLPRRLANLPPAKLKTQLTADSLANAMVASSLASSRAPSPIHYQRTEPLFRQHSGKTSGMASFFLLHSPSHTPAPQSRPVKQPGLRQTLRRSASSSEEEDSRHRSHQYRSGFLIKKHPNKHAEGARRRWRDSITERERKRYEGVWAANKGLLYNHESAIDSTTEFDDIHGLIVKDIWSRSGLGPRVLGEVWELVESGGRSYRDELASLSDRSPRRRGRLKKHEFVVGLWLVDQCLKGRKLPIEVQESVWASSKGLLAGLRTR